ncbi:hypothetical protein BBJ28_00010141 [Nothophytophthora sp. Chile5]|nr:hypothetical protein BBJ28_00010141 [Nothophytophthora sp. Chile5]
MLGIVKAAGWVFHFPLVSLKPRREVNMASTGRRGKAHWTDEDDIRLCRAYVSCAESSRESVDGSEQSRNLWTRVHARYAALTEADDPNAAPRNSGALQTHWASLIRPDVALFESTSRFVATREKAEEEELREYEEEKQRASSANSNPPPPKPRAKTTTFRFLHCLEILRSSDRFMRSVLSEEKGPLVVNARKRRRRRSAAPTDAEETPDASEAGANPLDWDEVHVGEVSNPRASTNWLGVTCIDQLRTMLVSEWSGRRLRRVKPHRLPVRSAGSTERPANEYLLLKTRALRDRRAEEKSEHRLKLLAELRGVVATIAQLANEFVSGSVTSMAVAAQTEARPTLAEEVKEDLHFFRQEKCRLKRELDALDAAEAQR